MNPESVKQMLSGEKLYVLCQLNLFTMKHIVLIIRSSLLGNFKTFNETFSEKRGRKRKKDDFDENSMGLDDPVLLAVNEEGNIVAIYFNLLLIE